MKYSPISLLSHLQSLHGKHAFKCTRSTWGNELSCWQLTTCLTHSCTDTLFYRAAENKFTYSETAKKHKILSASNPIPQCLLSMFGVCVQHLLAYFYLHMYQGGLKYWCAEHSSTKVFSAMLHIHTFRYLLGKPTALMHMCAAYCIMQTYGKRGQCSTIVP